VWNEDEGVFYYKGLSGGGDAACRYQFCSRLFAVITLCLLFASKWQRNGQRKVLVLSKEKEENIQHTGN